MNPTIQFLKKDKFTYPSTFVGNLWIIGATLGNSLYFLILLFKIYIAILYCALRLSVKKKIPWCNNKGNNISCKSVLLNVNLTVGLLY